MAESLAVFSVLCFLAAFAASVALTVTAKRFAIKFGLLAYPKSDRFHTKVMPLGGGFAIFVTILLACIVITSVICTLVHDETTSVFGKDSQLYIEGFANKISQLWIILGCSAVLFLLGLWDDIKNIKPVPKLIVEFAVAFAAAYWGEARVELFIENRIITSALSSFWIVLIVNSFNFLDNMDGASAGIAAVIALILFIIATLSEQVFVAGFAVIFAGTLTGFLLFNFYPASIFMGDAGSLVIGFFISILTLKTTYYHQSDNGSNWYTVLVPLVVMAIPLYDFLSVTILRISQGKNPLVGDTQHFSHRLKKRGLTETQAALTLYLATIATGFGAVVLENTAWPYGLIIFLQTIMVLAIIAVLEYADKNGKNRAN